MRTVTLSVRITVAWWLPVYLRTLTLASRIMGTEPDAEKVAHVVRKAIRTKLISTQRFDNTDGRMRGRKLQERRFRKWTQAKGLCASCGRLCAYPEGFQVDHMVPLYKGGPDTDSNCQVLCIQCHDIKTALDLGYKARTKIGLDGWPEP